MGWQNTDWTKVIAVFSTILLVATLVVFLAYVMGERKTPTFDMALGKLNADEMYSYNIPGLAADTFLVIGRGCLYMQIKNKPVDSMLPPSIDFWMWPQVQGITAEETQQQVMELMPQPQLVRMLFSRIVVLKEMVAMDLNVTGWVKGQH